jgi:hypothetical protein
MHGHIELRVSVARHLRDEICHGRQPIEVDSPLLERACERQFQHPLRTLANGARGQQ